MTSMEFKLVTTLMTALLWRYTGIKCGDYIDVQDSEGDWFESKILSVTGKIAKCHFVNYSSKWDCDIVLSPDKVAQRNTHSKSTGILFVALYPPGP